MQICFAPCTKKLIVLSRILALFGLLLMIKPSHAQVRLPQIFRDSMILQRDQPIHLWGWAGMGEKINVSFQGKRYKTTAAKDGSWKLDLAAFPAGGPYIMEISGKNKIQLKNILMGDVWLCSGQSNMVHYMSQHNILYQADIDSADYPQIRQFLIPTLANLNGPDTSLPSISWKPAIPEEVGRFSAVAFFFARALYQKYKVPIGIINSSVGGTPIEAWISEQALDSFPEIARIVKRNQDSHYVAEVRNRQLAEREKLPKPLPDLGLEENPKWYDPGYQPKRWRTINIPGYWEDQGIADLNGVVWYRREFEVPKEMLSTEAKVFLGRIVDADELYINAVKVGATGYQYPQRRYQVPDGLLKEGKNLFVIRVTNNSGKGGFVPDKPYQLIAGKDTIDLKGYWQYRVGQVFPPIEPGSLSPGINPQNEPTALFNAMIAPLIPYTLKGILWYQGESNSGRPSNYAALQDALIADWRQRFHNNQLPFLYVQLPNFMDVHYLPQAQSNWALFREAQMKSLSVPNTGMAVAIDAGEWNDIHPDNKKSVGDRLALLAQKIAYDEPIVASGPLFESAVVRDSTIVISFSLDGSSLSTSDAEPPGDFAIAGADKQFVWAKTEIRDNKVIVWSPSVAAPKYVRYAWADNPEHANLINKEGLPASPFRTDQ